MPTKRPVAALRRAVVGGNGVGGGCDTPQAQAAHCTLEKAGDRLASATRRLQTGYLCNQALGFGWLRGRGGLHFIIAAWVIGKRRFVIGPLVVVKPTVSDSPQLFWTLEQSANAFTYAPHKMRA